MTTERHTDAFASAHIDMHDERPEVSIAPAKYEQEPNLVDVKLQVGSTCVKLELSPQRARQLGHDLIDAAEIVEVDQ